MKVKLTTRKRPVLSGEKKSIAQKKRRKLPKKGFKSPDFNSLTRPAIENPLDYGDSMEMLGLQDNVDKDISIALQAVLDERMEKRDEYRIVASSDYYFVMCFQTEEQKLEFLDAIQWRHLGERFIDGLEVARILGVEIEPIDLPLRVQKKKTPKLLRGQEVIR